MLAARVLSRSRLQWAGLCTSYGDLIVDAQFILPKASSTSGAIVKVLHESKGKGLNNSELWEAVQDFKLHVSKGRMKYDIQQLKALGYIRYWTNRGHIRNEPFRAVLTPKCTRVLKDDRERERLTMNEGMPADYEEYLLPGMDVETTHIVKELVHTPKQRMYLDMLWKRLEPYRFYEDFSEMRLALNQLRAGTYVIVRAVRAQEWQRARKAVVLSGERVTVKENKIVSVRPFVRPSRFRRMALYAS